MTQVHTDLANLGFPSRDAAHLHAKLTGHRIGTTTHIYEHSFETFEVTVASSNSGPSFVLLDPSEYETESGEWEWKPL